MILFALTPNLNVPIVSNSFKILGLQLIIKVVLLFPPKLSYKIRVSFEFLYGINELPSVNAFITFPKQDNDWLIFLASSRTSPSAPVLLIFSDPAKSTKNSFPVLHICYF